ncbi:hypothetical protein MKX08_007220 [Trichoderma sp. CBMAI-0020]|nr:hypothetical protein MKX08_007220 [Trichoderma sp. CBMAI-0020]
MSKFFQQALNYHTQMTLWGKATVFIAQSMLGEGGGTLFFDTDSPRTNFTATATCDTRNCTWQSFKTLAICNTCVNLSSGLDKTRIEVSALIKAHVVYTNHHTLPNRFSQTGIQPQSVGTEAMYDGALNMTTSGTANY